MQAITKLINQTPVVSNTPPLTPVGETLSLDELTCFLLANTNKIATTIRTKFPAWYTKHYGKQTEEKLYKRILSSMIESELVNLYVPLGCSLKNIETMINEGLARLVRESKIPPNHQEIMESCQRVDGVPDLETAWHEALKGINKYTHDVVKATANAVGISELRSADIDNQNLKGRFQKQLIIKTRLFKTGKDLNKHVMLLDSDSREKTPAEVAELSWQHHEKMVIDRIAKLGVSNNPDEARKQALATLGLKDRRKEART